MVTGSPMMVMSGVEKYTSSLSGISLLSPEGSDTADKLFLPENRLPAPELLSTVPPVSLRSALRFPLRSHPSYLPTLHRIYPRSAQVHLKSLPHSLPQESPREMAYRIFLSAHWPPGFPQRIPQGLPLLHRHGTKLPAYPHSPGGKYLPAIVFQTFFHGIYCRLRAKIKGVAPRRFNFLLLFSVDLSADPIGTSKHLPVFSAAPVKCPAISASASPAPYT